METRVRSSAESARSVSKSSVFSRLAGAEERPQPHAELLLEQLSRLREILGYDQAEKDELSASTNVDISQYLDYSFLSNDDNGEEELTRIRSSSSSVQKVPTDFNELTRVRSSSSSVRKVPSDVSELTRIRSSSSSVNDAHWRSSIATSRNRVELPAELVASKARIDELVQQLRTTERLEAVADLQSWFTQTTPRLLRSLQKLTFAQVDLQRTSDMSNDSRGDYAMMLLQDDCVRTTQRLSELHQRLKVERRRGLIQGAEEYRQQLLDEISKMAWEEHVGGVQLQDTQERIAQLQEEFSGLMDKLPPGTEFNIFEQQIAISAEEQERLDKLRMQLQERSGRLHSLREGNRNKSRKILHLREILRVMKQLPEDESISLHASQGPLQQIAEGVRAGIHPDRLEALKGCNTEWLEAQARAKEEDRQTVALKQKASAMMRGALAMLTSSSGEAIANLHAPAAQGDTASSPNAFECSSSASNEDEQEAFELQKAAHETHTQHMTQELERLVALEKVERLRAMHAEERLERAKGEAMSLEEAAQTLRHQMSQGIQRLLTENRKAAVEAVEHSLSEQQQRRRQQHEIEQQQSVSSTDWAGMMASDANTEADAITDVATVGCWQQKLEKSLRCAEDGLGVDMCAQFLWPQSVAPIPKGQPRRKGGSQWRSLRNLAPALTIASSYRNTRARPVAGDKTERKHDLNVRIVDAGNLDKACDKLWKKAKTVEALLGHGSDAADGSCSRAGNEASQGREGSKANMYHGSERIHARVGSEFEHDVTLAYVLGNEDDKTLERIAKACAHISRLELLLMRTQKGGVQEAYLANLPGPSQVPLCVFTSHTWNMWLVSITIRALGSSETPAGRAVSSAWKATLIDGGSSCVVCFSLSREFLAAETVATTFELNVRSRPIHELKLIERHYFKDRLIRSHIVQAPFAVPNAVNSTWEVLQEGPLLDEDVKAEMVACPWETRSDSFFLVQGKLVLHCRAMYSFLE